MFDYPPFTSAYVVEEMSNADYHSCAALSSTGARTLLKDGGAYLYKHKVNRINPDAARYGSAAHGYVLEDITPTVAPYDKFTTKAAKEWKTAHEGDEWVSQTEWEALQQMRDCLYATNTWKEITADGYKAEISLFWTDPETGLQLRARPDLIPNTGNSLYDYKTTIAADRDGFAKKIYDYGYHFQAAWYLEAAKHCLNRELTEFTFIAQEKNCPAMIGFYTLHPEWLEIGRAEMRTALNLYADYLTGDLWPALPDEKITLPVPAWVARKAINNDI